MAGYEIFAENLLIIIYILRNHNHQGIDCAGPLHQKLNPIASWLVTKLSLKISSKEYDFLKIPNHQGFQ